MTLTVNSILTVALCVATAGLTMSYLFSSFDRPYLHVVYGTRARIAFVRGSIWLGAITLSLAGWVVLSQFLTGTVALGIFFGLVAVLLDICGQRIRYIELRPYPIAFRSDSGQPHAGGVY